MRRSTIIILLLFILAAGGYYYLQNRPEPVDTTHTETPIPTTEVVYLFDAEAGVPTLIRLEAATGEVVELARNEENAWALTLPIEAAAEQGSAEAASSQLTTIQISDRVPNLDPATVGLDTPAYILTVAFKNSVERTVEIGVLTPTESGYYVRSMDEIVIVSRSAIDALVGLLTNPPYVETPTPSPIPPTATNTPVPSPTIEVGTATESVTTPTP